MSPLDVNSEVCWSIFRSDENYYLNNQRYETNFSENYIHRTTYLNNDKNN